MEGLAALHSLYVRFEKVCPKSCGSQFRSGFNLHLDHWFFVPVGCCYGWILLPRDTHQDD